MRPSVGVSNQGSLGPVRVCFAKVFDGETENTDGTSGFPLGKTKSKLESFNLLHIELKLQISGKDNTATKY